jgi:hypothetical protein
MADNETSTFPKMGDSPLEDFINVSGDRSPYTKPVARKGPGAQDSMDGPGGGRGRGATLKEGNGPKFAPQTQICYTNDPVAHATGRGMRKVPSAIGNRDFWDDRASQSGETIVP